MCCAAPRWPCFETSSSAFEAYDIRPAQYSILTVIECNPGLKQSEVSEAPGIQRTQFVAMIDELQRRGLVRRPTRPPTTGAAMRSCLPRRAGA